MSDSPFAVLFIAPTLELGQIKRGYFAALAKTPPHADQSGFRRLREAYEQLLDSRTRELAFLQAPSDETGELAAFEARWGARIEAESAAARAARDGARNIERFVKRISAMTWDEIRAPASPGPGPAGR